MGLGGGGYTFLKPSSLLHLSDAELQDIFRDRTSFLLRFKNNNNDLQSFGVLKQLLQYRLVGC